MRSTYVSINRLANADTTLDSTLVTFRGEVVGDVLASATTGRRWITMQATSGARATIGVLMDETQIALISYYGAYQTKGTTLLVTGIYRVADDNETGTLDVTAYDVSVVEEGGYHPQKITISKLYVGGALTFVGITLLVVGFVLKRRNRA